MRAYATSTARQGDDEPFHQHTYRFPHYHWIILALMFSMASANPDAYPRKDPKDGTLTELIRDDQDKIESVRFTKGRYIRMITRL